ncbi:MAG: hypothetical protein DMF88_18595, partial [Acidobacteria bacterium]
PIYSQVPAIGDFVQQEPHEGEPATERTELWIFFDETNIYFAVRCLDDQPERIIANEMRRDSNNIFQNDNVQLVIDTFYDRRSGVLFQTNALGALSDQEVSDERNFNRDWNTVWDVKAARTEEGWSAEFVIPFKSLRYRASGPQTWGFNIQRRIPWKNERSYLSGVPASYGGRGIYKLSSAATLVGLEVPPQGRNLELKPYGISAVTTNRQAKPAFANDLTGDAGFDVKYGLTKGLTADVTYNTDFAQVEEDEQQVNLTRFSLFFPEKREFFLEGQGIFGFGPPTRENQSFGAATSLMPLMFFSRQIGLSGSQEVPILAGGRVTGRAGRNAVGLLNIETRASEQAGAAATNFSVVRVRRDILRRSAIGLIGTGLWCRCGARLLRERDRQQLLRPEPDARTPGRRVELHGTVRLRRRSVRDERRASVGRRRLQSRDRISATRELSAELRAGSLQSSTAIESSGAQGERGRLYRLHHRSREQAGKSRGAGLEPCGIQRWRLLVD